MFKKLYLVFFLFCSCLLAKDAAYCQDPLARLSDSADWANFQKDVYHSANSPVNFPEGKPALKWLFSPTSRTWSYKSGSSVWSSSVSIARLKERSFVYAGFYNNNFYALDAANGSLVWRFISGNRINYAPAFARVNDRALVFFASADRSIYCLDALSGNKLWSYETLPWSYMLADAIPASPLVITIDNSAVLVCPVWNSSKAPLNNFRKGELYFLNALTGEKIFSLVLSTTPLNSPCFANIGDLACIFISSSDGNLFAVNARNGQVIWKKTLDSALYSSPSVITEEARIFIGSRFGNLYCLDARDARIIWTQKAGHAIDSTPAIASIQGKNYVYTGSYDRHIYCFEANSGKKVWSYKTGDYVVASPVLAKVAGKEAVFIHSLDNKFYCLDALTGLVIWDYDLGKLIWSYNTRGDTIWSSPAIGMSAGPILVFPCYDGKIYAFGAEKT